MQRSRPKLSNQPQHRAFPSRRYDSRPLRRFSTTCALVARPRQFHTHILVLCGNLRPITIYALSMSNRFFINPQPDSSTIPSFDIRRKPLSPDDTRSFDIPGAYIQSPPLPEQPVLQQPHITRPASGPDCNDATDLQRSGSGKGRLKSLFRPGKALPRFVASTSTRQSSQCNGTTPSVGAHGRDVGATLPLLRLATDSQNQATSGDAN